MSSPNTIRWQMQTLDPAQTGSEVTVNQTFNFLDMLGGGAIDVKNSTTTTPPGSPANGDTYLVGSGATGAWASHDNQIAYYYNGWYFFTLQKGCMIYDETAATLRLWNGSVFKTITLT